MRPIQPVRLGSPAALVTTRGLAIASGIQFSEWLTIGRELWKISDQFAWCAGDWLAYGARYERGQYDHAVAILERDYNTVRAYKRVAQAFESARRRADSHHLRWSHFEAIAHLEHDDQERLLDDCEMRALSVHELRNEATRARGLPTPPPALSFRTVGELYDLTVRAASARGLDPRDWVAAAIREKAAEDLGIEAAP